MSSGGWAKADNVASNGLFALDFKILLEGGSYTWYYDVLRFNAGTHDWQKAESTVSYAKGITMVVPSCLLVPTGTAWIDDLYAIKN